MIVAWQVILLCRRLPAGDRTLRLLQIKTVNQALVEIGVRHVRIHGKRFLPVPNGFMETTQAPKSDAGIGCRSVDPRNRDLAVPLPA